ncbi:MAG TPA: amidohydrolase family protein [Acidimicrobiales bacterium]|nr:amidohydrolase family protein [Acidimicrobiales bacterium]
MSLVLRGGTLLDATGTDPQPGSTVVLDDDRITSTSAGYKAKGKHGEVLDLEGLTVLPGLIDAHTHLGGAFGGGGIGSVAEFAAEIFNNLSLAVDAGFTTCRELGGVDDGVVTAVRRGLVRGPRIFHSGKILCQTGGHGDYTDKYKEDPSNGIPGLSCGAHLCDSPHDARYGARLSFKLGATQLKVCLTGGVVSLTDSLEDTQFTVDELRAIVAEARARQTYVTAHVHNNQGIRNGLEAGIECFEHGTAVDEETAGRLAAAGAALVPTLTVAHVFQESFDSWGLPEAVRERVNGVEEGMTNAVKVAKDAGVLVGMGSDLIGSNQNRRGLEIVLRAAIEGPMEAILGATAVNAKVLRKSDEIGTIEVGKKADVIAVSGDPLTEPELFDDPSRVVLVIRDGQIMKDTRR